jgi:hypothetical protein
MFLAERSRSVALVLASFSFLATSSFASVIVVDASGGGNFTAIQPAVDAANDGDVILVKSGTYAWFAVGNKALAIVGDAGSSVHVDGSVRVQNLAAGKTVVIENVKGAGLADSDPLLGYGLYVANNQGRVRIENCNWTGAAPPDADVSSGIYVNASTDVSLTRTIGHGGSAHCTIIQCGHSGGAGLVATSSTLTIHDSTFRGGNGSDAYPGYPFDGLTGGTGASLGGVTLFASNSSFLGGFGGAGGHNISCFPGTQSGDGGDGLDAFSSHVWLLADIARGGEAGPEGPGLCDYPGSPGFDRYGGTFTDLSGQAKRMVSPTPLRENAAFQLTFVGAAGDRVALVVADDPDYFVKLAWKGVWLVKTEHPLLSIPIGTIPPSGTLTVNGSALGLGGLPSRILHVQPVFVGTQGIHTIGTPSCVVTLSQLY